MKPWEILLAKIPCKSITPIKEYDYGLLIYCGSRKPSQRPKVSELKNCHPWLYKSFVCDEIVGLIRKGKVYYYKKINEK